MVLKFWNMFICNFCPYCFVTIWFFFFWFVCAYLCFFVPFYVITFLTRKKSKKLYLLFVMSLKRAKTPKKKNLILFFCSIYLLVIIFRKKIAVYFLIVFISIVNVGTSSWFVEVTGNELFHNWERYWEQGNTPCLRWMEAGGVKRVKRDDWRWFSSSSTNSTIHHLSFHPGPSSSPVRSSLLQLPFLSRKKDVAAVAACDFAKMSETIPRFLH